MFLFSFIPSIVGNLLIKTDDPNKNGDDLGFINLKIMHNHKKIKFTKDDVGIQVKLVVGEKTHKPTAENKGPFDNILLSSDWTSKEHFDGILTFNVTNNGTSTQTIKLGTLLDVDFLADTSSYNEAYGTSLQPLNYGSQKGFFIYVPKEDGKSYNSDWNIGFNATRFESGEFIAPSHIWYGAKNQSEDLYFKSFPKDEFVNFRNKDHNEDLCISFSWEKITLEPKQSKILGFYIYTNIDHLVEVVPLNKSFRPLDESFLSQNHPINENITINYFIMIPNNDYYHKITINNQSIREIRGKDGFDTRQFNISSDRTAEILVQFNMATYNKSNKLVENLYSSFRLRFTSELKLEILNDQNKWYNPNEQISVNIKVKWDYPTNVSFKLYRHQKTELETVSNININSIEFKTLSYTANSIEGNSENISISSLDAGKYSIKASTTNKFDVKSEGDLTFYVSYNATVKNVTLDNNAYIPGENVTLTGKILITNLKQSEKLKISFMINNGITSEKTKEIPIKSRDVFNEFDIGDQIPNNILPQKTTYTIKIYPEEFPHQIIYNKTEEFNITNRPSIKKVELKPNLTYYSNNSIINVSLDISDDSQGTIFYTFGDATVPVKYNTNNGTLGQEIQIPVSSFIGFGNKVHFREKVPYLISFSLVDEHGKKNDDPSIIPLQINILNKPTITGIDLNPRGNPNDRVPFTVNFTDYDRGKNLILHRRIHNSDNTYDDLMLENCTSSGGGEQQCDTFFTFPSSEGNNTVGFYLKYGEEKYNPDEVECSNYYQINLSNSKPPTLLVNFPENTTFADGENITIDLIVSDEPSSGVIKYLINGEEADIGSDAPKSYKIQGESKNITFNSKNISIPRSCKYLVNNGFYTLKIQLIDEFGRQSNHCEFKFMIRNTPVIDSITFDKYIVRTDSTEENRTIQVSANVTDKDENKSLYIFVKEGENADESKVAYIYNTTSNGKQQTLNFTYEVKVKSAVNYNITFWVEDDQDPLIDPINGQSDYYSILINATYAPKMTSVCPQSLSYKRNDSIEIRMTVDDNTNGRVKFFWNGTDMKQDAEYSADNEQRSFTKNIKLDNNLTMGNYTLLYYPLNEYGFPANIESMRSCDIQILNKPNITSIHLSKDKADDDETVYVYGTVNDFDTGKPLYIYQKILGKSDVFLGNITSNGDDIDFNMSLKFLKSLPAGDTPFEFWASSINEGEKSLDPNAFSEHVKQNLFMANDPSISVINPDTEEFQLNESINFTFVIIAELKGRIEIYDNQDDYKKGKTIGNLQYTTSQNISWSHSYSEIGDKTIYFNVIGENGTSTELQPFKFTVRYKPEIISIEKDFKANRPGTEVRITCTYRYIPNGNLYPCISMNGQTQRLPEFKRSEKNQEDGIYTQKLSFQLDNNQVVKILPIQIWLQTVKGDVDQSSKYAKSNVFDFNVTVTVGPTVQFIYPQKEVYEADELIAFEAIINDDTEGRVELKELSDGIIETKNYSSYGNSTRVTFTFKLPETQQFAISKSRRSPRKYYYLSVYDEFENNEISSFHSIYKLSKPILNSVEFMQKAVLPGSPINCNIKFVDKDKDKKLYLWTKINNQFYRMLEFTSSGSNGSSNFTFSLPRGLNTGDFTFPCFLSTEGDSRKIKNNRIMNADSLEIQSNTIRITFTPTISLNKLDAGSQYTKGDLIPIKGKVKADQSATIKFFFNNNVESLTTIVKNLNSNSESEFEDSIKVPDNLTYNKNMNIKASITYVGGVVTSSTITFQYKTKPLISNLSNVLPVYVINENTTNIKCQLVDHDKGKLLYRYYQIGNGKVMKIDQQIKSNGGDQPQEISFQFKINSESSGEKTLYLWVSESDSYDEKLNSSNKIHTYINITKLPDLQLNNGDTLRKFYSNGQKFDIIMTINDEEKIFLNYIIDGKHMTEEHEMIGNDQEIRKTIEINGEYNYGRHIIAISAKDNFGFSSKSITLEFNVINKPNITSAMLDKQFVLQSHTVTVLGTVNDMDAKKRLVLYAKIGDNEPKQINTSISTGGENQTFSGTITIDENESTGTKDFIIYFASGEDGYSSDEWKLDLDVTFKPSLEIYKPEKEVYNDGETINFNGTIKANSNVTLLFTIDTKDLPDTNHITVMENPQTFTGTVTIPDDYKYGTHTLSVVAVDKHQQKTDLKYFTFFIQNPPKIIEAALKEDKVKIGGVLIIKGTVRDPDIGSLLTFYGSFDDKEGNEVHQLESDSKLQPFEFYIHLSSSVPEGSHVLKLYVKDPEGMNSSVYSLNFTLYTPKLDNFDDKDNSTPTSGSGSQNHSSITDNSDQKARKGYLAAIGVVAALLAILIVLALVIFFYKKKVPERHSYSNESDIEQRETEIMSTNTINMDEVATHDNPLFSSNTIGNDTDPFSDEFEEQNP